MTNSGLPRVVLYVEETLDQLLLEGLRREDQKNFTTPLSLNLDVQTVVDEIHYIEQKREIYDLENARNGITKRANENPLEMFRKPKSDKDQTSHTSLGIKRML
ncbi:chaperone protein HtpG [Acrasis kona]|uniref:Chaperone protein HtpG n=1 Tax=Acrasis kona TaxID=1008807 RepID=A0AAW2Z7I6_9EUKA